MHPAPGVRSLLACYERAISENEKAGVTSRMFLNNVAKQPSSRSSRIRSRETPVCCAATSGAGTDVKGSPRHEDASLSTSISQANVTSLANAAGKSSRFQLTRSSSTRNNRASAVASTRSTTGSPSALEHQLGKHAASKSTRVGKSDATISTAGSSVPDDVDVVTWSLAGGDFGLDEGSDEDDRKASSFSPFKQRRPAPPAVGLRERLAAFQPETTNVPLSLRTFHRSSSSRSLRPSSDDDDDSNGFKVLVHRPTGEGVGVGVDDDDASITSEMGAKGLARRPQISAGETPCMRDSILTKHSSSRSLRSTTARNDIDNELGSASCHSVRDHRSTRVKPQQTSPTKERSASVVRAENKDDHEGSSSSICSRRSLASSLGRRSEKSAGRDTEREMGDLDSRSSHSVTNRQSRRSLPTLTADTLKATDKKDVQYKERSTCSPSKSAKDKTKPSTTEPPIDTNSKPSSKVKRARGEPKVPSGRSSTHSKTIASSKRNLECESGREKLLAPSRRAGGTARSAPTERRVAPASKVNGSPSSPTASHHGSWTLALDDDGPEIDISPGSTTRSPKVVAAAGSGAPKKEKKTSPSSSSPPPSTKRPATKVRRKEPGARRSSSAKASASEASPPSRTKRAASSRPRLQVVSSAPSPTAVTAEPKTSSLERRRQRYQERLSTDPTTD
jgi:hypothetical protein